jgi:hypothetical protein
MSIELTISEKYTKYLKFCYGNKEQMIKELSTQLKKYQQAENQENPELMRRIKIYSDVLEYAEAQ